MGRTDLAVEVAQLAQARLRGVILLIRPEAKAKETRAGQ